VNGSTPNPPLPAPLPGPLPPGRLPTVPTPVMATPVKSPSTSATATTATGEDTALGEPPRPGASLVRQRRCRWLPSTASSPANAPAPSRNVHHGSISSDSDAGTAYTHSRTRPVAAGAAADTASASTSTATSPIAIVTRHRIGGVESTGGRPVRICSPAAASTSPISENAAGPGKILRIPVVVNEPTIRKSRTSSWASPTRIVGVRSERSASPVQATSTTATKM